MSFLKRGMKWLMGLFSPAPTLTMKPLLKENEHYCFVDIPMEHEPVSGVKLLEGPFPNVVYYYGHVKLVPEGDSHKLAFQFTIWDSGNFSPKEVKSVEFVNWIGDVLVAIIADENKSGEYYGPSGTDDSEKSDLS